jgi:hypothetical protein
MGLTRKHAIRVEIFAWDQICQFKMPMIIVFLRRFKPERILVVLLRRWTDRQRDKQTDGWTDRQIDG